jgi:hypothetical protein
MLKSSRSCIRKSPLSRILFGSLTLKIVHLVVQDPQQEKMFKFGIIDLKTERRANTKYLQIIYDHEASTCDLNGPIFTYYLEL